MVEKPKAFVHVVEGGVPTLNGSPKALIHLIASLLCTMLQRDPSLWDCAQDEVFAAFKQNESTGRTILRWVNYIAKGIIVALALFGSVCLGVMLAK
jgi:hypothetical protein